MMQVQIQEVMCVHCRYGENRERCVCSLQCWTSLRSCWTKLILLPWAVRPPLLCSFDYNTWSRNKRQTRKEWSAREWAEESSLSVSTDWRWKRGIARWGVWWRVRRQCLSLDIKMSRLSGPEWIDNSALERKTCCSGCWNKLCKLWHCPKEE